MYCHKYGVEYDKLGNSCTNILFLFPISQIFLTIAAIPKDHDVHDYYFIGALLALSCAVFTAASIVLATKVLIVDLFV